MFAHLWSVSLVLQILTQNSFLTVSLDMLWKLGIIADNTTGDVANDHYHRYKVWRQSFFCNELG